MSTSSVRSTSLTDQIISHLCAGDEVDADANAGYQAAPSVLRSAQHLMAAQMAGAALGAHFRTLADLADSKSFIAMSVRSEADARLIGRILEVALPDAGVKLEPSHRIKSEDRFLIIMGSGPRLDERMSFVSVAANRGLPVIWLYDPSEGTPLQFTRTADLALVVPAPSLDMLSRTFVELYGRTPTNLADLSQPEAFTAADLALHFRLGRTPEACITSLKSMLPEASPVKVTKSCLNDIQGYGAAKTWALELRQDFDLWQRGGLAWDEIDQRAAVLAGPPGTGKTTFSGLLAGSLGIPLITTSVAEWNSNDHLSGTLKAMRAAFETAMSQSPSVLLIDELDGISSRSHISGRYSEYWTQIVNLMLELVTKALATEGVVIVGATNFVERIDPALTRSGRLDQIIKIDPPNEVELTLILSAYVGLKHPTPELKALAGRLRGKTGADIRSMVRSAKSAARRSGQEFSVANLEALVRDPRDRLPASARRRLAIYQAGQIVATRALGLVEVSREYPKDDDAALSFSKDPFLTEQNCNDILVALVAGRAAEEILMAEVSVMGAWNENSDLASATRLAGDMETRFGFGETGLIYLDGYVSDHVMSTMVVGSIRRRIEMAMTRASTLLLENRQELEAIVTQLVRAAPLQSHAENIRV